MRLNIRSIALLASTLAAAYAPVLSSASADELPGDGKTIRYLNINDRLADADGRLFEGLTMDQLHPSLKGYQIWAEALEPVLTGLLGPRAATDTAPPPTGDPSAKR